MRRVLSVVMVAGAMSISSAAPGHARFDAPVEAVKDAAETPAHPLDLRAVTFGQTGTRMVLNVRTRGAWEPDTLAPDALCVELFQRGPAGSLCIGARGGAPVLLRGAAVVPATIRRPSRTRLEASFSPHTLGLTHGRVRWQFVSRWTGGIDRAPEPRRGVATLSALAQTRCFGAAARAPGGCRNASLARTAFPTPRAALWSTSGPCHPRPDRTAALRPCEFGDRTADEPTIALIGDSHADHWRAAANVAALALGARAVNMTRAGCSFSSEVYPVAAAQCRAHNAEALQWLAAHPSVHTVITSSSAGRGLSAGGYRSLWSRVPASVRRIYVIRDVPRVSHTTGPCIEARLRRRSKIEGACSVARGGALIADSSAQAAAGAGPRVRLVDLTRHFCSAARCFPVVGGAYVYKDANHMNATFSRTLGPYLLRRLR